MRKRPHDYDDEDYDDDEEDDYLRRIRKKPELGDDPAMRMLIPVGRSGWAIAAGYLGLLSVLCVPAPLALIAGVLALQEIHRNPKKHGMGRAIFGIVMGAGGTLFLMLILAILIMGTITKP